MRRTLRQRSRRGILERELVLDDAPLNVAPDGGMSARVSRAVLKSTTHCTSMLIAMHTASYRPPMESTSPRPYGPLGSSAGLPAVEPGPVAAGDSFSATASS